MLRQPPTREHVPSLRVANLRHLDHAKRRQQRNPARIGININRLSTNRRDMPTSPNTNRISRRRNNTLIEGSARKPRQLTRSNKIIHWTLPPLSYSLADLLRGLRALFDGFGFSFTATAALPYLAASSSDSSKV